MVICASFYNFISRTLVWLRQWVGWSNRLIVGDTKSMQILMDKDKHLDCVIKLKLK